MIRLQDINYLYISLTILWLPIQRGFLHVDGKSRTIFLLTIIVFFSNILLDKRFFYKNVFSKPAVFWLVWILYSAINLQLNGYYGELSFTYYFVLILLQPFVVMTITAKETSRNPEKIFKLLTFNFTLFAFLSITILGGNHETHADRLTGEMGNTGPLNTINIILFSALLFIHKKLRWRTLVPIIIFAFAVISLAATRKAFGAAVIISFSFILSQIKLSPKSIFVTFILLLGIYSGGNYALENTALAERFEQGKTVGAQMNTTNIQVLDLLGDRAFFYIQGWEVFNEKPLTGIGLKNFMHKGYSPLVIHSEYMVQLAECGIIGSILFLLFYYWIGKSLVRAWRAPTLQSRPALLVLAGGFGAILFINFTAWTYQFVQYFAVYGVIIGYLKKGKINDSNTQHRE